MSTVRGANVTDGLPKQFVTSLRILFDILDEDRTGFVRLRDIETRWHEEGVKGLPSGVIDSLRKVAPKNGKLDFHIFVTGLKHSLIKQSQATSVSSNGHRHRESRSSSSSYPHKERPVSAPIHGRLLQNQQHWNNKEQSVQHQQTRQQHNNVPHMGSKTIMQNQNMAAVRPNNIVQSQNIELRNKIYHREQLQQATFKKQPKGDPPPYRSHERNYENLQPHTIIKPVDAGPVAVNIRHKDHLVKNRPKSTDITSHSRDKNWKRRSAEYPSTKLERSPTSDIPPGRPERPPPYRPRHESPPSIPPRNIHGRIMHELKSWQREQSNERGKQGMHTTSSDSKLQDKNRLSGEEIYVNIEQIRKHAAAKAMGSAKPTSSSTPTNPPQKTGVRRQNSRRHTLSNGVDYNVIRRMKQLEQEKDSLLQGLAVVDRTREWYHKQIALVSDKQNYVEKTSCSDVTLQSNQERMDFVMGRINEVNMNLKSLMESTESNFPAHMNLAVRSSVFSDENKTRWLKDQNKQLTKEVGDKSEFISKLEKEKATLIRDLFEARSKHKTNFDDTTFM